MADAATVTVEDALAFLATGSIQGEPADAARRREFLRLCLKLPEFRAKAWPHFACFVDASNVARRRPVPIHEVNTPKARLADLDAVVDALRRLRYAAIVVSDANLFQLIDEPYEWQRKYSTYPHSVAHRRQADPIILRALRELPEAVCVTNDRFSKPDELRDYGDVLAATDRFHRHVWDGDTPSFPGLPDALTRLAARLGP